MERETDKFDTHRRESLEELQGQYSELMNFLSRLSHDIRTPLQEIQGNAALALERREDGEYVRECLEGIRSSADYLRTLFDQILAMNRLVRQGLPAREEVFSPEELVRYYVSVIVEGQRKHHLVQNFLDISHRWALGDRKSLGQILANLLSNAVKYTPDGGEITCELRELSGGQEGRRPYILRVKDSGIGISREFQKVMFEPFTRESEYRGNKIPGTGLGLSIVRELLCQVQGEIEVYSEVGQGTEFVLRFTLGEVEGHVEAEGAHI